MTPSCASDQQTDQPSSDAGASAAGTGVAGAGSAGAPIITPMGGGPGAAGASTGSGGSSGSAGVSGAGTAGSSGGVAGASGSSDGSAGAGITTIQADDVQIIVPRAAGALSGLGTVSFGAIVVVRAEVPGGYTLDVTVPWAALNNASSQLGKTIGFDLAIDDDADGGTRDAQLMLYGTDQAFQNTSFYGDLLLD